MIGLKAGVELIGLRAELLPALIIADQVYTAGGYVTAGGVNTMVTSVNDSEHSLTSLHYAGAALDLRIRHVPMRDRRQVRDEIAARLTDDFDVILEHGEDDTRGHIHIEYQPRASKPAAVFSRGAPRV